MRWCDGGGHLEQGVARIDASLDVTDAVHSVVLGVCDDVGLVERALVAPRPGLAVECHLALLLSRIGAPASGGPVLGGEGAYALKHVELPGACGESPKARGVVHRVRQNIWGAGETWRDEEGIGGGIEGGIKGEGGLEAAKVPFWASAVAL